MKYIFCNYVAVFLQSLVIFNTFLLTLSKKLYIIVVKFPCLDFRAHHERYKETLNKLRQRIRTVRPNRHIKDVLLLHDNAGPHTNLRTRKAVAEMGWSLMMFMGVGLSRRVDLLVEAKVSEKRAVSTFRA
jgi:hypothetical protein